MVRDLHVSIIAVGVLLFGLFGTAKTINQAQAQYGGGGGGGKNKLCVVCNTWDCSTSDGACYNVFSSNNTYSTTDAGMCNYVGGECGAKFKFSVPTCWVSDGYCGGDLYFPGVGM